MIYLDHGATCKPYKEVVDVMVDVMQNNWANPSASYSLSDNARKIIEDVREQIAKDINADPDEIIFVSGACEANNLAIQGYLKAHKGARWWTTRMEHASIHKMTKNIFPNALFLENDELGFVKFKPIFMNRMKTSQQPLISIGAANGEIGTIQDLKSIGTFAHDNGYVFHTDATQLFPERRIDVKDLDIDMMSVSAQKFNGPRGAGFLYVKNGIKLSPIIYGSQENGLRGGTYDTAAIAGMGEALRITRNLYDYKLQDANTEYLRNKLLKKLLEIPGTKLNGPPPGENRLVNNISLVIDGVDSEKLVTLCSLYGLYIGKGSACQSHEQTPSNVLMAIGLADEFQTERAFNTIRITLGYETTETEINMAADIIKQMVERIREDE